MNSASTNVSTKYSDNLKKDLFLKRTEFLFLTVLNELDVLDIILSFCVVSVAL